MAARFGLAVSSLVRILCPDLLTAVALRAASRDLQLASSDGVLCALVAFLQPDLYGIEPVE